MKNTTKRQESASEIKRQRTERKNTIITVTLLTVALVLPSMPTSGPNTAWDYAWAGLAFLGMLALAYTILTSYRQADELQKIVQLKAASLSFLVVIIALFTAGLAHALTDVPLAPIMQIATIGGIGLYSLLAAYFNKQSAHDK